MNPSRKPFNRISRRYRLVNSIISIGMDYMWRKATIRAANVCHGNTVLDLGSGAGELLEMIPSHCQRIGIDPEKEMLACNLTDFYKIISFGEKLPIGSMRLDRVISTFVLRNLDSRAETFGELYRVMKIGGQGALTDFSPPRWNSLVNPIYFYLKFGLPIIGGLFSGDVAAYRYLSRTILAFPEPLIIVEELRLAGFHDVTAHRLVGGVAVLYTFRKNNV